MEFAVVAPVYILILFGIIEISRGLMVKHLLTNAARVGCRTGILAGKSTSDINTSVQSALNGMGISGHSATVQVNRAPAEASTAKTNDVITVQVSVPLSSVTWFPVPRFLNGNITGMYVMRRE
jgi:Flp pilus assembly protein TadG